MSTQSILSLAILLAVAETLTGCAAVSRARAGADVAGPDSLRVRRDIEYLASDALEGRGTGTPGYDSAAMFAVRRYAALGLQPLFPDYLQRFQVRSPMLAHSSGVAAVQTQNIAAQLPGRDTKLRGQFIVIGAHIDHLGRSTAGALDPEAGNAIRNGADDNASGTAAVWELARLFRAHPARHPLIFVNFSGEELSLLGSEYFVQHPPIPLDSVVAMINFDMVGRMRHDSLIVRRPDGDRAAGARGQRECGHGPPCRRNWRRLRTIRSELVLREKHPRAALFHQLARGLSSSH